MSEEAMVCDFCSSPDVVWMFPADTFTMFRSEGADHVSLDDWAACEICAHLIEQELWDDLTRHAYQSFQAVNPTPIGSPMVAALVMEAVRGNTTRFQKHRKGPAVRVGKEDTDDT